MYDYAEIEIFTVNYDLSQGKLVVKRGRLGEKTFNQSFTGRGARLDAALKPDHRRSIFTILPRRAGGYAVQEVAHWLHHYHDRHGGHQ